MTHVVRKAESTSTSNELATIQNNLEAGFDSAIHSCNTSNQVAEMKSIEMGGRTIQVPSVELQGFFPPGTVISNMFYNPKSKVAGGNGLDGLLVTLSDIWEVENRDELIMAIEAAIPEMSDKEAELDRYENAVVKLAQASTDINLKHYLLVRFVLVGGEKEGRDGDVEKLVDLFADDTFSVGKPSVRP